MPVSLSISAIRPEIAITTPLALIQGNSLLPIEQQSFREKQVFASVVEFEGNKWKDYLYTNYEPETANLLTDLIYCESSGNPDAIIMDTNNKISKGILMFQEATFMRFCQGKWGDPINQIDCAVKILQEENGWQHWFNCFQKIK